MWTESEFAKKFQSDFNNQTTGGNLNLGHILEVFRVSRTIEEASRNCSVPEGGMPNDVMMDIVKWLLCRNIIQQQHTYVYFMCPDTGRPDAYSGTNQLQLEYQFPSSLDGSGRGPIKSHQIKSFQVSLLELCWPWKKWNPSHWTRHRWKTVSLLQ